MYDLITLALNHERANEWHEALEIYRKAHRQDPSREPLIAAMVRLLVRLDRVEEANNLLEQLLSSNPGSIPARLARAELHEGQGDRSGARRAYDEVLDLCPDHLGASIASSILSEQQPYPRLLFVLGMHRTGTSAVSGALCRLGCRSPASMPPADSNNPTGYWEPLGIVRVHNSLLEQSRSSWDDPFLSADLPSPQHLSDGLRALEGALRAEFSARESMGRWCLIKDPRQCRLQPFWNHLIQIRRIQAAVVLVNRHPLAVAASLRRRNNMPINRALLLWIQHQMEAESHTRGIPRQRINYEDFVMSPASTFKSIMELLENDELSILEAERISSLVRPDLNHSEHRIDEERVDADEGLIALAEEVYQALQIPRESEMRARMDSLRENLESHFELIRSQLGKLITLQLFWKPLAAKEFTESCSLHESIIIDRATVIYTFCLPRLEGPINALRFDPAECPCLVRISRLTVSDSSGLTLWTWRSVEPDRNGDLPFVPANLETQVFTGAKGDNCVSVLCEGHDPALLLILPDNVLFGIESGSKITVEARWEILSSEISELLASFQQSNS